MKLLIDLHLEETDHQDEVAFRRVVCETLQLLTYEVRAMRAEVQGLVNQVTDLKNAKASSDLAWKTMIDQTASLKEQVGVLQKQAAAGGVDADSLAAIVQVTQDVHDVAVGMLTAVPANTPAAEPDAGQG